MFCENIRVLVNRSLGLQVRHTHVWNCCFTSSIYNK